MLTVSAACRVTEDCSSGLVNPSKFNVATTAAIRLGKLIRPWQKRCRLLDDRGRKEPGRIAIHGPR